MDNYVRRGRGVRGIGGSRGHNSRQTQNIHLTGDSAIGLIILPSMEESTSGQLMPGNQVGTSQGICIGQQEFVTPSGSQFRNQSCELSQAAQPLHYSTESEEMDMDIASQMAAMNLRPPSAHRGGWPCSFGGLLEAQEAEMDDDDTSDQDTSVEEELPFDAPPRSESPVCPVAGFFAGFYELGGINILIENHRLADRYTTLSRLIDHWAPLKGALPMNLLTVNKSFVIARIKTGLDGNSDSKCIRGKVVAINHECGTVTVRNLDVIEKWNHTVSSNEIFWMTPEFKRLPLKVNVCKLWSMERWSETAVCQDLARLTSLEIGDRLTVVKCSTDRENDCLVLDAVCHSVKIEEITYERVLISSIFKHLLRRITRVPETFYPGLVIDFFHLIHIETTTGVLFFTMHLSWDDILHYKRPDNADFAPTPADHPDLHQASPSPKFVARSSYSTPNLYYRARVIDYPQSDGQVRVQFVDYGNIERVTVADMIPIGDVDPLMESVIPQGRLSGIKLIVDADEFFDRIPGDLPQRGMITHIDEDGIPNIELYAKYPHWSKWVCVNELGLREGWARSSTSLIYQPQYNFMIDSTEQDVWSNYKTGVRLTKADSEAVAADLKPYSNYIHLF